MEDGGWRLEARSSLRSLFTKIVSALDQTREFLRSNRIDRDLELKVLEVMDELERTVRIRAKFISRG